MTKSEVERVALEITERLVCDLCGGDGGLSRWTLRSGGEGRTLSVELCSEHSHPFDELFDLYPKGKRGARRRVHRVISETEISRMAAETRRKRPAKKP